MVDFRSHKFVLIINPGESHFGFDTLASAILFFEMQVNQPNKVLKYLKHALDEGVSLEGGSIYQIIDIDDYAIVYGANDEMDEF